MSNHQNTQIAASLRRRIRTGALALCALAAGHLAPLTAMASETDFTAYQSTTYGRASGDVPLPGFGLILELIGGDSANPRLRLFGGIPGNQASILISNEPAQHSDGQGNISLVAGQPDVFTGQFDGRGRFELDLGTLPAASSESGVFYAQGTQTGAINIDPSDGPVFELSHGLSFYPASSDDVALALNDILPHLPEIRAPDMGSALMAGDIEEAVRTALNSANDSVTFKLEADGSGGAGANAGAKIEFEVELKRTEDQRYELTVGQQAAFTAGLELVSDIEANAVAGMGMQRLFRFESIEGALYGVKGLALAQMFPNVAPGTWLLESGLVVDGFAIAQAAFNQLQQDMLLAETQVDQARALLVRLLDGELRNSLAYYNSAHAAYLRAHAAYHGSYWKTWFLTTELVRTYAIYLAANVRYIAAQIVCEAARLAVSVAEAAQDLVRQLVRDAAQELSRLGRIAWTIAQMRPYATDHFIGTELMLTGGIEAEVVVGIPGVTLQSVGAGASGEVKLEQKVRWEHAREGRPLQVGVTRHFEIKGQTKLGFGIAGELNGASTLELEDVFSISAQGVEHTESTVALGSNVDVAGYLITPLGGMSQKLGLGRSWSVKMAQGELLTLIGQLGVACLLRDPRAAVASIEMANVEITLQDRLEAGFVGQLGISVGGTGGGAGGSLIWKDQGRLLKTESTVGEAVGNLSSDALELAAPLAQAAVDYLN